MTDYNHNSLSSRPPQSLSDPVKVRREGYTPRDVKDFLLDYPHERSDPRITTNLAFYDNALKFRPYGLHIDEFHVEAHGRFNLLEQHHGYVPFSRYG